MSKINRREFLRSAGAGVVVASEFCRVAEARSQRCRPFSWKDAENRSNVERAVGAEDGSAIALQVSRPLSAGGLFISPSGVPQYDPRADLWMLSGELERPQRLAPLPGGAWAPWFSPDSKRLSALTRVGAGKVGIVVWERSTGAHKVFSALNVELFLAKFRTANSLYAAPMGVFQAPLQYVWLNNNCLIFVDRGSIRPQWIEVDGLSSTMKSLRERTKEGMRSVRTWNDGSPTCGANSRLVRMRCDTGDVETLYVGDVRGVSVSPGGRQIAVLVATQNVHPGPDAPMDWPLFATSGFDDAMVAQKLVLIDVERTANSREIAAISAVGNPAPNRLPQWSVDGLRVALPVRTSYSDAPATGNDAVWEVTAMSGETRKWSASSALDAELITAMLVTEGLDDRAAVARRPESVSRGSVPLGQIAGCAWRCAPGQIMFWSPPGLSFINRDRTAIMPGQFSSVQPPVIRGSIGRMLVTQEGGKVGFLRTSGDTCAWQSVRAKQTWTPLLIGRADASVVYEVDEADGSFLILSRPRKRPHWSSLSFNRYFRNVARPTRRMLSCTFSDGTVRHGLLQLPISHSAGKRHPVVVWAYPNSIPSEDDAFSKANNLINVQLPIQYLLTKGFAFFEAPFPIGGPRSAYPMNAAVDAVMPWLDILATQPEIIPGEYGFFGHSNAGYVALALEALTRRFKALVAWDTFPEIGFDTLHSYSGDLAFDCAANLVQSDRMFYEDPTQPYAPRPAPPWRRPEAYIRSDPVFNLRDAETPMLLVEGELDSDPKEMEEVYSILYGKGVPVEMAYYWGEGHLFASPGNVHDSWLRTERFFGRYLQMS